jgi:hypothetical protein
MLFIKSNYAFTWEFDFGWPIDLFYLIILKVQLKVYEWLYTLKQSCSKLYEEQKLFNDHLMKMTRIPSNRAHKSGLGADSALSKFG